MRNLIFGVVSFLLPPALLPAQSAAELDFLTGQVDGRALRQMLASYLQQKAVQQLGERRRKVEAMRTPQDAAARKQYIRERILHSIGGLPAERTPLNARVTAVLDRSDHRVEKVIFESQPRFFVTANLYVPKQGQAPHPAILFPLGHEPGAKAHTAWQQVLVSLVRRGFVCLTWDPIGQGERVQLFDPDTGDSKVVRSTTEHTLQGIQSLLLGDTLARFTIWDGLRALDYLVSRPEVDARRIGLTGNSGGGTHTAYIAALDDRIQVAAPSCYITSWQRLLETIGPQDAEQCMPPFLADGLDHADFIHAFAPKPYRVLSAIRDFFPISGARESFAEARRVYGLYGEADKLTMAEADDGHGYSLPRRLAAYRWFTRWLQGTEDDSPEAEVTLAHEEELNCTHTGQVATELGGETVHSLNVKRLEEVRRRDFSAAALARFISYQRPTGNLKIQPYGETEGQGWRMERLVFESETGIRIPALLYRPQQSSARGVVYVHGAGKSAAHADAGSLAQAGLTVLSIDARGMGETRSDDGRNGSDWPRYFGDFASAMTAMLTGKPLVAMRAEDVSRAVDVLLSRGVTEAGAIGHGLGAVPVLYGAALDDRIRTVGLEQMIVSYEAVVRARLHRLVFENAVHGALRRYDLPDLVRWTAPRQVRIVDATTPMGKLEPLESVRRTYPSANARVARRLPGDTAASLYYDQR